MNIPKLQLTSLPSVWTLPHVEGELTGNRFNYLFQLLIARKFSDQVSLQLVPSVIHFNLVPYGINNSNNVFFDGTGQQVPRIRQVNHDF